MNDATPIRGYYERDLPPPPTTLAILTEAISELNRTPGTETDAAMAKALMRILAERRVELRRMG